MDSLTLISQSNSTFVGSFVIFLISQENSVLRMLSWLVSLTGRHHRRLDSSTHLMNQFFLRVLPVVRPV